MSMSKTQEFIKKHKFAASEIDIKSIADDFISEMNLGLEGKPDVYKRQFQHIPQGFRLSFFVVLSGSFSI